MLTNNIDRAEAGENNNEEEEEDSDEALLLALEEDEEEPVEEEKGDDEFSLNGNKTKKRKRTSTKRDTARSVKRKTKQEVEASDVTTIANEQADGEPEQIADQTENCANTVNNNNVASDLV